jgi:hypothetical protein
MKHRCRSAAVVSLILVAVCAAVVFARPYRPPPVRASNAVGDATCLSCHREKASFEETAHRLTSQLPSRAAIEGSFSAGENVLQTANPQLHYRMDSMARGYYETAVSGRAPDTTSQTARIDIVTGVRKGQSYLYWQGDQLYQLPVSSWRGIGWINSPGYRDGVANFDRPIAPRCVECHATRLEPVADARRTNRYRLTSTMLGIGCETCHGAGRMHAARERSPLRVVPTAVLSSAIINPARFSRGQRLDACALCHAGLGTLKTPAFSFLPGQRLEQHLDLPMPTFGGTPDVHGNQLELLIRSRCFQKSQMTCATCHNVHETQRDVASLSGRCLSCHTVQSCGLYPERGNALVGRCVDCHMPLEPSNVIISSHNGQREQPLVRTHWIRVYPRTIGR